jgi:hypothetical protein
MQFKYDLFSKYYFRYLKKLLNVSHLFENDIFMKKIQYTFNKFFGHK